MLLPTATTELDNKQLNAQWLLSGDKECKANISISPVIFAAGLLMKAPAFWSEA